MYRFLHTNTHAYMYLSMIPALLEIFYRPCLLSVPESVPSTDWGCGSIMCYALSSVSMIIYPWVAVEPLCYNRMYAAAKSLQSCPALCDPIGSSPPGSAVPGILQTRTLEWVAISFSNAWKWKVKGKSLSSVRISATPWTAAYQAPPPMGFSRQEYWSGVPLPSLSLSWKETKWRRGGRIVLFMGT